jgi:hypothetical protein
MSIAAEGQARGAGHHVEPDGRQQEAGGDHDKRLGRRAAHADEGAEGDHQHREHLRRAEAQRHLGKRHGEEGEQDRRDDGAEEGDPEAGRHGEPALPCLASGRPSNMTATDQGLPGTANRIEVIRPPYIEPQ